MKLSKAEGRKIARGLSIPGKSVVFVESRGGYAYFQVEHTTKGYQIDSVTYRLAKTHYTEHKVKIPECFDGSLKLMVERGWTRA